jgi:CubicO group peptidase (beta-lactamase class C family)
MLRKTKTKSAGRYPMTSKRIATLVFAITAVFPVALLQAQGLPAAPPDSVGMSAQKLGRISEAFKQQIDKGNLPGVVVMVARKGRLVYSARSASRTRKPANRCPRMRYSASTP